MPPENQAPSTPPPSTPQPAPQPVTAPQTPSLPAHHKRTLMAIVVAVIVLIIAGLLYYYVPHPSGRTSNEPMFSLFEGGSVSWYVVKADGTVGLSEKPVAFGDASFTTRYADGPIPSGDTAVIVDSNGDTATELGVVRTDGTFVSLVDDAAVKNGLSVRPDGTIAYASYVETKTKTGTSGEWLIKATSAFGAGEAMSLGSGFSPIFASDGTLIAIGPEGLVRIDLSLKKDGRTTLIERPYITYGLAAISDNATAVVLPNDVTHTLDVFTLAPDNPTNISYLASVPTGDAAAFLDPHTFIVKTPTAFITYGIEKTGITTHSTYTYAP